MTKHKTSQNFITESNNFLEPYSGGGLFESGPGCLSKETTVRFATKGILDNNRIVQAKTKENKIKIKTATNKYK
jgi:hypothetical protein